MSEHIQKILLGGIILGMISSFGRADYNLPIFIFAAFLWEFEKFHTRIVYLLLFSFIIDFIYAIYWYIIWEEQKDIYTTYNNFLHKLIIIIAILIMIIKIIVLLLCITNNREVKNNLQLNAIKDNLINFIYCKNTGDD